MKSLLSLLLSLTTQGSFQNDFILTRLESTNNPISYIAEAQGIDAEASALKTIITTGFGVDTDSATRNAAENALNEVVGSIVSSEKLLEKRSVISNGIKEQTKSIKTNIVDYSQGSLKSIRILEAKQSNGLYTVTIKAVVRIEDFTRFIEKLARDERRIDAGIFAGVQANRDNITTKFTQFKEVLSSIPEGKAQEVQIGEAFLAIKRFSSIIPYDWTPQETVVIPVEIRLKSDYATELTKTLRAMALETESSMLKPSMRNIYDLRESLREKVRVKHGRTASRRGIYVSFAEKTGNTGIGTIYFMPNFLAKTQGSNIIPKHKDLKVTLTDRQSFPIKQSKFNSLGWNVYGRYKSGDGEMLIFIPTPEAVTEHKLEGLAPLPYSPPVFQLLGRSGAGSTLDVYSHTKFFIFLNLTREETDQVRNIVVEFKN